MDTWSKTRFVVTVIAAGGGGGGGGGGGDGGELEYDDPPPHEENIRIKRIEIAVRKAANCPCMSCPCLIGYTSSIAPIRATVIRTGAGQSHARGHHAESAS